MWPGQDMATPCAVPPKCDATCFTHLNGVSIAHAQAAAKCGKVRSEPQNSYQRNWSFTGTVDAIEGGELVRRAVEHALRRSRRCRR